MQPFKLFHLLIGLFYLCKIEGAGRLKDAAHQSPIFGIDLGRFESLQLEEVLSRELVQLRVLRAGSLLVGHTSSLAGVDVHQMPEQVVVLVVDFRNAAAFLERAIDLFLRHESVPDHLLSVVFTHESQLRFNAA